MEGTKLLVLDSTFACCFLISHGALDSFHSSRANCRAQALFPPRPCCRWSYRDADYPPHSSDITSALPFFISIDKCSGSRTLKMGLHPNEEGECTCLIS